MDIYSSGPFTPIRILIRNGMYVLYSARKPDTTGVLVATISNCEHPHQHWRSHD